jgi:hypothetical protein
MGRSAASHTTRTALVLVALSGALLIAAAGSADPAAQIGLDQTELLGLVTEIAWEHGLDPRLVHALIEVESGWNPLAVSRRGAMGLMQLMPPTARRLGVTDPFDPEQNLRAGVNELRRLVDRYSGDLPLALAAYNAGEGAIARYGGVPPYRETRGYVRRIMSLYLGKPYHHGQQQTLPQRAPVRLVRDSGSGEVLITNVGAAVAARAQGAPAARSQPLLGRSEDGDDGSVRGASTRPIARRAVLGGGFGTE